MADSRFHKFSEFFTNRRAAPRWWAEITQYALPPSTLSAGIAEVSELATNAEGAELVNNDFLGDCRIVAVFNLTDRGTPCSVRFGLIWHSARAS